MPSASRPEPVTYSISDLARELDITTRAIRFYEEQGLLSPERRGQERIYSPRDKVSLKLILRGKRIGFSLAECRELIELYDPSSGNTKQLNSMLANPVKDGTARMRAISRVSVSEWPPRSKKLSFTPTGWPKISLQIAASFPEVTAVELVGDAVDVTDGGIRDARMDPMSSLTDFSCSVGVSSSFSTIRCVISSTRARSSAGPSELGTITVTTTALEREASLDTTSECANAEKPSHSAIQLSTCA